jgi:phage recombination protein Bet
MNQMTTTPKELISFDAEKVNLIRETVAKELTPKEFELFMSIARTRGLDPVLNQIHAIVRGDKVNFQVGIDGFRLIAARTGEFAGRDETEFTYKNPTDLNPERAKVTVYRFVNGQKCSWTASAKWKEYVPAEEKKAFMWKKLPETMLEKCAEAKALRMAFPNDLSGLYEPSEMDQASTEKKEKDVTPKTQSPAKEALKEMEALANDPGEYTFDGGRHHGKKLKEFSQKELIDMANQVKTHFFTLQKPVPAKSQEVLDFINAHLNNLEMQP